MINNQIFNLEKFDSYLELSDLINNIRMATSVIKNLKSLSKYENQIKILVSYLIENEEIMATNNKLLQNELCNFFIFAFSLTPSAKKLFEDNARPYLYRLFHLLAGFFSSHYIANLSKHQRNMNNSQINLFLQKIGYSDLFLYATDQGSQQEIFDTFITIISNESVDIIVNLVNHYIRTPNFISQRIYERIYEAATNGEGKDNIVPFLQKLSDSKKKEVIQNIKTFLEGVKSIHAFEKVSQVLNLSSDEIYNYVETDLQNENPKTRELALKIAIRSLFQGEKKSEFIIEKWEKYKAILLRHNDNSSKIRIEVILFAFDLFSKMKQKKREIMIQDNSIDKEIFESTEKHLNTTIWNVIREHIVDKIDDVRFSLIEKLGKIDVNDIELNYQLISFRLKDKLPKIRPICLKILINLQKKIPDKMKWLFQTIIDLYQTVKDISLFGVSLLMENCSFVSIIQQLNDKRMFYQMLKDIFSFQNNFISYKDNNDHKSKKVISKFFDPEKLNKIIRVLPKNISNMFSYNNNKDNINKEKYEQQKIYKVIKTKTKKEDARLLSGLFQPVGITLKTLLKCDDLEAVKTIAKIFAQYFICDISILLNEPKHVHLLILSSLKKVEFADCNIKKKVLETLIDLLQKNDKLKEKLILKSFAHFVRKDDSKLLSKLLNCLLKNINDDFEHFQRKLLFYSHFVEKGMIPNDFNDEIEKNLKIITGRELKKFETDKKNIKSILKIISNENSERNMEIHFNLMSDFPKIVFKSYINCAYKCFNYVSPTIFRQIAYSVIQNEYCDVRESAISALNESLKKCTTPIQFLALFVLSATDPNESNRRKAKEYFENQVKFRQNLILEKPDSDFSARIAPETALPYAINLLAHHRDFSMKEEDMTNTISTFSCYLKFFFEPICMNQKNFPKLLDILFNLQLLEDIEEGDYTEKMYKLCELASTILKKIGNGREWNNENNLEEFSYSKRYFKEVDNKDELYYKLINSNNNITKNDLFESGNTKVKNILRAGMLIEHKPLSDSKLAFTKKKIVSRSNADEMRSSQKIKGQEKMYQNEEKVYQIRNRIRAPSPSLITKTFRPV